MPAVEPAAGALAALASTALVLHLVVRQPRLGRARFEALKEQVRSDPGARLAWYRRGICAKWAMTVGVAAIALLAVAAGHDVALPNAATDDSSAEGWMITIELMIALPLSLLILRSGRPRVRRLVERQVRHLWPILPASLEERRAFVGVSVTAGVTEEVLYRWFLPVYLLWLAPDLRAPWVVVLSGIAFGLAHWYQGRWGVLATGVAGMGFGALTMATGTLVPAVIVHTMVDLRIIALPGLAPPPTVAPSGAAGGRDGGDPPG